MTSEKIDGQVVHHETEPLLTEEEQELVKNKDIKINAKGMKAAYEYILGGYGMLKSEENPDGFEVIITDEVLYIDVRDKSVSPMTIYIPEGKMVTADELLEFLYHEIEGHARMGMNGMKMFKIGGGALRIDDETWYEGLAMRFEADFRMRYFGVEVEMPEPFYTLAINDACEGKSFAEIFNDQVDRRLHVAMKAAPETTLDYEGEDVKMKLDAAMDAAWKTTFRVMRGHFDTTNKDAYAFTKDLAYLRGWLLDQELVGIKDERFAKTDLGHFNEVAIMGLWALPLLGRLDIDEKDIPYPFRDLTHEYCTKFLLPWLESKRSSLEDL